MKWKTFLFQIIKMSFYSRIKPTQNTNNICRIFFKIAENMLYNSTLHLIVFWITLKRMNHLVWQADYKPFAFQFFFPSEILIITSLYQICFLPRETQDSQVKTFDDKMERHNLFFSKKHWSIKIIKQTVNVNSNLIKPQKLKVYPFHQPRSYKWWWIENKHFFEKLILYFTKMKRALVLRELNCQKE